MNRFRSIVLGADVVGVLTVVLLFSATSALAKQCSTERPSNARSYWSYRLIDGRKCWYEGKPMLSKSELHWPASRTAQPNARREANVIPANDYNPLDAQAAISDERKPKPQANLEVVDASPVPAPKRTLTRDDLRTWANSMAAMTAQPIMTILDRWPDEELPQHRTEPPPVEQPSPTGTRTIMTVVIVFMALLAGLMTTFRAVTSSRRDGVPQLLRQ